MSANELHRLFVVSEHLERVLLRIVRIVGVTLLLAIVLVPLVRVVPDDRNDPIEHLGLSELIATVSEPADQLLDDDTGLTERVGLTTTRISVVVLIIGGIATLLSALAFTTSSRLRDRVVLRVSGATLLVGGLLLWVGSRWLPAGRHDEIGPAWGIAVPVLAAVWVLSTRLPADPGD